MPRSSYRLAADFASDRRGNVAMIFALVLVPILGIVSLSIDYGRALKTKSQLYNAGDAALQSIVGSLNLDRGELNNRVRQTIDANLPEDLRGIPFTLTINEQARSLTVETATTIPTAIMALMGVSKMDVVATSTLQMPEAKPALDLGPIMAGRPGSSGASGDAKGAADRLLRELQRSKGTGIGDGLGLGANGMPDMEATKQALENPEMQRLKADIDRRMSEALRARR